MDEQMAIDSGTVKRLRTERAWSQEQLATVSGLSLRTIQRVECEGTGSLETRMALASAFNVAPAELMPGAANGRPATGALPRRLPGRALGVVFGVSGALLGGTIAACAIAGLWPPVTATAHGVEDGLLGAWLGITCAIAGAVTHTRTGQSSPG